MFIILKKESNRYMLIKRDPLNADVLAYFLRTDVCADVERYIKEFEDDYEHYAGNMNATQYTKHEDGILITPSWIIDEDESIEKGCYVLIKSLVLAELLRQWKTVYLQKPPYILVKLKNDIPTVTGFDELPTLIP